MQITCPDCGKPFEITVRSGEVTRPHCGENLRPEACRVRLELVNECESRGSTRASGPPHDSSRNLPNGV
jgi:hypothetical protein